MTTQAIIEEEAAQEQQAAETRIAVRKDLDVVFRGIEKLDDDFRQNKEHNTEIVKLLTELKASIEACSGSLTDEQVQTILDAINSKIMDRTNLTEYVNGELVPMCDKTKMSLLRSFAQTFSSQKFSEFKMAAADYVHKDEVTKRYAPLLRKHGIIRKALERVRELVNQGPEQGKEIDPVEAVWQWCIKEIADQWKDVKTGPQPLATERKQI